MGAVDTPPSAPKRTSAVPSQRRDLLELCIGYALILLVIWTPRPWQRLLYCAAAAFLIAAFWMSFDGWQSLGLRAANLARSFWIVGIALLIALTSMLAAFRIHTLQFPADPIQFLQRYWGYALWSFAQQLLLQGFFLLRLLRLIPRPGFAALASATIFSLAHLPSPILTVMTFVWGLAACLLFLRYRNLYPLAIAHAIFGITIAMTIPGPVTRNMRVGLGYIAYAHRGHPRS